MADFLLEMFSEEIPARMQTAAIDDLARRIESALSEARLAFSGIEKFVTPRRLAVRVSGLPTQQPDLSSERKGPKVGAPAGAVDGFCRSVGLTVEQLEQRDIKGEMFYFAVVEQKGQPTKAALTGIVEGALRDFPWPKSMRWGAHAMTWVRPLKNICCLLEGEVVPVSFGHLTSNNITYGHRFLSGEAITLSHPREYEAALEKAHVIADAAKRKATILNFAEEAAKREGLALRRDERLLEEVTGLVEWPAVSTGGFEKEYLDLPPEVLVLEMRHHQKYFALQSSRSPLAGEPNPAQADLVGGAFAGAGALPPTETADAVSTPPQGGSISNRFLLVANMPARDGGKAIVHGNQRVLKARLEDGKFYWNQDRQTPLAEWAKKLDGMLFHAKLGSMAEKAVRIQSLALELNNYVKADAAKVGRAAQLAKADLVTGMVGEFPELQGVMGRYYATAQGEDADVADAIRDHYKPAGAEDDVPTSKVAICVSLADKLDSLVGLFAAGEKPTGSKDPFALRRAALGIIRIVLENNLRLPLMQVLGTTLSAYSASVLEKSGQKKDALLTDLLAFFADRLKVMLKDQGVRHDVITAVFEQGGEDDLVRLVARAKALQEFLGTEDGANLLTAYKRASNIVAKEEKKDGKTYHAAAQQEMLQQDDEKALFEALATCRAAMEPAMQAERYGDAMKAVAALRVPVDTFFDKVTVNADDAALRINRLSLLSAIRSMLDTVASFEKIEG